MRVRGEDLRHLFFVSLNVTPPLMHGSVIKARWGMFPEMLVSTLSRMDCSTIFPTFRLHPLTSAYKNMAWSCLTIETCFKGV